MTGVPNQLAKTGLADLAGFELPYSVFEFAL